MQWTRNRTVAWLHFQKLAPGSADWGIECGKMDIPMPTWTVRDRYGNMVYLTAERWQHILESQPELEPHFDKFLETLRTGRRRQDTLIPNKYRYYKRFDELLPENNRLVVIVIFQTRLDAQGQYVPNNFVVTGWANYIRSQR